MFRSSQLFPKSDVPPFNSQILLRRDIVMFDDYCIVTVRWSKTNQCRERILRFPLCKIDSHLCPFTACKLMCHLSRARSDQPAFGILASQIYGPIIYSKYLTLLRAMFYRAGYVGREFSSHSFRRGGATWAFKSGVPDFLIKVQGDWASNAYREYLDVSMDQRLQVFHSMTEGL